MHAQYTVEIYMYIHMHTIAADQRLDLLYAAVYKCHES